MNGKVKKWLSILLIFVLSAVVIWLLCGMFFGREDSEEEYSHSSKKESTKLFDGFVLSTEEVTISTEVIEDGLRDMGVLITQEYYFTMVEEYTDTKKVLFIFPSVSSFIYSYDGVVTAGIDCTKIDVSKDDTKKEITISIPKSDIYSVNVDQESFKVYEEKERLWNQLTLSDFNSSRTEFENSAKEKALSKGILKQADTNAKNVIKNFVDALQESDDYRVNIVTREGMQ